MRPQDDPVLKRFRAEIDKLYGDNVDRVVLFGSRARGDARADSDYDVAVFLKKPERFWREAGRLAAIETDILYDTNAVINALPIDSSFYDRTTSLMGNIHEEGVPL